MDKEHVMILKVLGAKTSKTEKNALLHAIYCINQRKDAVIFFAKTAIFGTKKRSNFFLHILYNQKDFCEQKSS